MIFLEAKRNNPSGYDDRDFWALEKGIISEKLENEFELCNRMKKIIDSTDNMIEVLCMRMVKMFKQNLFDASKYIKAKPVVKWAGGKTQMLDILVLNKPEKFNKYIEPFIGGGALFFDLSPENAIISDSNPELINLYKVIADDVDELIVKIGRASCRERV